MIVSSVIASDQIQPLFRGERERDPSNFFIYGDNGQITGKVLRTDWQPDDHRRASFLQSGNWADPITAMQELERLSGDPNDVWFSAIWDAVEEIYQVHIATQYEQKVFQLYPHLMSTFQIFVICKNSYSQALTLVCDASFPSLAQCFDFATWFKRKSLSIQIMPSAIADSGRPSFFVYDRRCDQMSERAAHDEDFVVIHDEDTMNRLHWHNNYHNPFTRGWYH